MTVMDIVRRIAAVEESPISKDRKNKAEKERVCDFGQGW